MLIDVFEAYGANLAMVLRDDDVRSKRFKFLRIDSVDGEPFLHDGLDPGVDFVTRTRRPEFRLRQGGQARYIRREVAFMGTTNKKVAGA